LGLGAVLIETNTRVSDGEWHNVTVSRYIGRANKFTTTGMMSYRNNDTAFLKLDNMNTLDVTSSYVLLETTGNYWIGRNNYVFLYCDMLWLHNTGGHEDITITSYSSGLISCITNLIINGQPIDLADISLIASSSNVIDCEL